MFSSLVAITIVSLVSLLAGLGWWLRVYPTRRLVQWAILPAVFSCGLIASSDFLVPILAFDGLVVLAFLADLATLPRRKWFVCQREIGLIASLRKPHDVRLTIGNRSRRAHTVAVRDDLPDECTATPEQFQVSLPAQSRSTVSYQLHAQRRGAFTLGSVYLRATSRFKLWQRFFNYIVESSLHVYPDMAATRRVCALARTNRLSLVGVRRRGAWTRQRVRAAARLHARRQLQAHRLAQHRAAQSTDRQGFSSQSEPARAVSDRLRPHDDQHGRRESACSTTRSTRP